MINLLLFLVALACFSIAGAWVAENPGSVTIYWFDWRVDTSFAFLLLAALAVTFALAFFLILLRRVASAPKRMSQSRKLKHYQRGLAELTYSVAALGASDIRAAETHTRKAEKLLGRTPLTLLLSAQIARSQGDDGKTRHLLEQMLEHKETEYLAARSLSEVATKQQRLPQALSLAERAHAINPQDRASVSAIVSLRLRLGQWQEALSAIDKASWRGHVARAEAIRLRGIVHLKHGQWLLDNNHPEAALAHAKTAAKLLKHFAPATLLLAKAYDANRQTAKGIKLIIKEWPLTPQPELSVQFRTLISKETPEKRMKLADALATASNGTSWSCSGCGQLADRWDIHCPACGAFDLLIWK